MPAGDLRPLKAARLHEERGDLQPRLEHFDAGARFEDRRRIEAVQPRLESCCACGERVSDLLFAPTPRPFAPGVGERLRRPIGRRRERRSWGDGRRRGGSRLGGGRRGGRRRWRAPRRGWVAWERSLGGRWRPRRLGRRGRRKRGSRRRRGRERRRGRLILPDQEDERDERRKRRDSDDNHNHPAAPAGRTAAVVPRLGRLLGRRRTAIPIFHPFALGLVVFLPLSLRPFPLRLLPFFSLALPALALRLITLRPLPAFLRRPLPLRPVALGLPLPRLPGGGRALAVANRALHSCAKALGPDEHGTGLGHFLHPQGRVRSLVDVRMTLHRLPAKRLRYLVRGCAERNVEDPVVLRGDSARASARSASPRSRAARSFVPGRIRLLPTAPLLFLSLPFRAFPLRLFPFPSLALRLFPFPSLALRPLPLLPLPLRPLFRRAARLIGTAAGFLGGAAILLAAARLLLLLPRPLAPPFENLLALVARPKALRTAQPFAGMRCGLPVSVADGADAAVHEPNVMPLTTVAHQMLAAERAEPRSERRLRAIADAALPASGLAAARLLGIVGVHPPERGREGSAAPRAGSEAAAARRAALRSIVPAVLDAHRRGVYAGRRPIARGAPGYPRP